MTRAATRPPPKQPARRPNVVVIVVDDLGQNDVSLNRNLLVRTPHIDAIARDGAAFVNGYSGDAVCAPSRAALLTGRCPQRYGFEFLPVEAVATVPIIPPKPRSPKPKARFLNG